ncbi:tetratricopeptide repeat protein [Streptomyces abyssalis]|nr:tetratricopeptide repeat protein [Streptomyces abyssalis]
MDISEFVGREQELRELRELVEAPGTGGAEAGERGVLVAVVEGMAGVGKTRFAVRAAHEFIAQDRFADVQLWADLKGFTPERAPVDPANVLEDFLRLLGVPGDRIPGGVEARAALYRDRLARRRALVVLDDAADEEQVRHLLPGSASCLLLITSRRVLSGLDGAHTIRLDVFSPQEAVELIDRVADRTHDETGSPAAMRVAELSGRLPIAVALAGRRLRTRPAWSMDELADRLETDEKRLAQLTVGRRAVEATFDLSYQWLSPAQQRAFTLLAAHPGPDCTADSAAALLGTGRGEAEDLLESLLDEHLLQQHVAGRYRYHDLLRLYARDRAADAGSLEQRTAAVRQLVRWYCAGAETARLSLEPWWHRGPAGDGALGNGVLSEEHPEVPHLADDADSALKWLEEERANLLAVSREAAQHEWRGCTWRLATAAHAFLGLRSYGTDCMEGLRLGLTAARGADGRARRARTLADIGMVCDSLGRHEEAARRHHAALAVFEETGDRHGAATAHYGLGCAAFGLGRYAESAERHHRALALFEETGDRRGQALVLGNLGLVNWFIHGRYRESEEQHRRALTLSEECGDRRVQAYEFAGLGLAHWFFGNYAECARQHRRALALFEETGDRRGQAIALNGLGLADWHLGRLVRAGEYHQQALTVFREVCDRRGEAVALQCVGYANWATGRYDVGEKRLHETLAVCAQTGNRSTEAWSLASLGHMCLRLQRNDEGQEHLEKALSLSRSLGDRHPEASALVGLALVSLNQGQLSSCEEGARQALALSQSIGNPHNETWAMITLGLACCFGDRPEQGADWHRRAAETGQRTGDLFTESMAVNGIGYACTRLGRYEEAERHLRAALTTRQHIGDRHGEAETLTDLAALMHATGRPDAASAYRELAQAGFAEIGVTGTQDHRVVSSSSAPRRASQGCRWDRGGM